MAEEKEQSIIIKKYKKGGDAAHGGSWKVAYADFVTAMMAFFLLMWLLNMSSAQKKIVLSQYFQNYSIFEKGGGSSTGQKADVPGKGMLEAAPGSTAASPKGMSVTMLADKLRRKVEDKLPQFQDRVVIADDNGSLRIELIDTDGESFFQPGGTQINANGQLIIRELALILGDLNRKLVIEGHTDIRPTSNTTTSNWELSTQRALTTRLKLEKNGVHPEQIEMVVGYAANMPFVKENPADPKNRRVSLVVDYREQASKASSTTVLQKASQGPGLQKAPNASALIPQQAPIPPPK